MLRPSVMGFSRGGPRFGSLIVLFFLLWACLLLVPRSAVAQRFLPDDPISEDPDRLDMPVPVARSASDYVRFLSNTFVEARGEEGPAINVNTLNQVPNSSWYKDRHFASGMSLDKLRRGAGVGRGPQPDSSWVVESIEAVRPVARLMIRDADGERYELRLDSPDHPVLATAAGAVANRAYYALGYFVPELTIVRFAPGKLVTAEGGDVRKADIWEALNNAPTLTGGVYRAAALRIPEPVVERVGPFLFHSTRPDDGNDIFPHERRRELRGLFVAAAWLNHTGIRATRTLDVGVKHDGHTFVRHYVYNTFEALGSAQVGPKEAWMGREHLVEISPVLVRMGTLGLSGGDWVNTRYPDVNHVGRFGATNFDPERWRPEHPNPAFAQRDSADTFWMARKIAHFTDREIRAMVEAAEYPDSSSVDYVTTTLARRRDSIAATYLGYGGGLDGFRVSGDRLIFEDLLNRYVDRSVSNLRFVQWHRFSNEQNRVTDELGRTSVSDTSIDLPEGHAPFYRVRIMTPSYGATDVYLREVTPSSNAVDYEVVGVERHGRDPDAS
ncbi:hypothetical protein CRI94_00385 [Longibacter salinarum]|uniref:Uncharacterized protein n=1 Tax=Longibacter salinarum TaxID=1850348 RepID=A0A2A8D2C1_9BACT|nr:hypothetical protein [Longibacter salinarum]PEN14788.1 hypothetical protein CRI94_00385 [Longibacter salinarum]